jgi:predicted phage terminase large subunit-like protein
VIEIYNRYGKPTLLIEDQGNGAALIQELKNGGIPAIGRVAREPKEVRLSAASSYIEAGQMVLPREAPWLAEFESELLGFPGVKHDDQVDSVSQYFAWIRERSPPDKFEYDFFRDDAPWTHNAIAEHILAIRGLYRP